VVFVADVPSMAAAGVIRVTANVYGREATTGLPQSGVAIAPAATVSRRRWTLPQLSSCVA
jgi:hypothetical protein